MNISLTPSIRRTSARLKIAINVVNFGEAPKIRRIDREDGLPEIVEADLVGQTDDGIKHYEVPGDRVYEGATERCRPYSVRINPATNEDSLGNHMLIED